MKLIAGVRYGMLVAIERHGTRQWLCRCDCGNLVAKYSGNLGKHTNSCGCYRRRVTSERKLKDTKQVVTTQIWNYYHRNARTRGLSWSLTREAFAAIVFAPCHYCGNPAGTTTYTTWSIRSTATKRSLQNNGVDRLDNTVGYTPENCVPACRDCNMAKHTKTPAEFIAWATRVARYQEAAHV